MCFFFVQTHAWRSPTGTWTYSYYSNNGNLNGNDGGMGGDYVYANTNVAFMNSNALSGSIYPALAFANIVPSFDDGFTAGGVVAATQIQSPLSLYTVGLNSVVFTGAKTGIAVGRYGGFHDYNDVRHSVPRLSLCFFQNDAPSDVAS